MTRAEEIARLERIEAKLDFARWLDLRLGRRWEPAGNPADGEVELTEEKPEEE